VGFKLILLRCKQWLDLIGFDFLSERSAG